MHILGCFSVQAIACIKNHLTDMTICEEQFTVKFVNHFNHNVPFLSDILYLECYNYHSYFFIVPTAILSKVTLNGPWSLIAAVY